MFAGSPEIWNIPEREEQWGNGEKVDNEKKKIKQEFSVNPCGSRDHPTTVMYKLL